MMRHPVRAPRTPFLAGLLLVAAAAAVAGADERPWVEVRSPRFTIVSEAGEKSAREMAWQFEQVHAVFTQAYPWGRMESGRPFIVLVARNEASLRALDLLSRACAKGGAEACRLKASMEATRR